MLSVRKGLVYLPACFFFPVLHLLMISRGLSQRRRQRQPNTHAMASPVVAASYLTSRRRLVQPRKTQIRTYAPAVSIERARWAEGEGMARLQAAGRRDRLLVMILLALFLFLLAVAPAQAARFTSNYLPVVSLASIYMSFFPACALEI